MPGIQNISELSITLRELAEKNRHNYDTERRYYYGNSEDNLITAFDWEKTPEGFSFWNNIYNGLPIQQDDQIIF